MSRVGTPVGTWAYELATGTHLAFMDDDDEYPPGAVALMRNAAADVPVIFRMDHYAHGILWRDRVLEFGNVSTQMYVVPNVPEKLGTWEPHIPGLPEPGGDYTFIASTVSKMGGRVWREEVIAVLRPEIPRGPSIAIVTPWHGHRELASDYFLAVGQRHVGDELLIVDNGSEPPLPFKCIYSEENLGFSGGCNVGLRHASADAVLFLNNDIAMLQPLWLEEIRAALEAGVLVGPLRDGTAYRGGRDGAPVHRRLVPCGDAGRSARAWRFRRDAGRARLLLGQPALPGGAGGGNDAARRARRPRPQGECDRGSRVHAAVQQATPPTARGT